MILIRMLFTLLLMTIVFFGLRVLLTSVSYQWHKLWLAFITAKSGESQFDTQGAMTVAEAYNVLGLKAGASKADIIEAHRKLIQKNHPDRGGSDYLATKINLAKKTLLKK